MTPWMDVIDKLRSLEYSITLDGEKLRYAYRGKDSYPSQDEITPLLDILKAHKEEILRDPCSLIEQTIDEINRGWQPGTLERMKRSRPEDWKRMIVIEAMINEKALTGDSEGLRVVLDDYRDLLQGMVKAFSSKREQTSLFNTLKKGDKADGEENYRNL